MDKETFEALKKVIELAKFGYEASLKQLATYDKNIGMVEDWMDEYEKELDE